MNFLLLYHKTPWTTAEYLQNILNQNNTTKSYDLGASPYWTNFYGYLPFYLPKGLPVFAKTVIKKYPLTFDAIIEIDSSGQYHLPGLNKLKIPSALWSLDTHEHDKMHFQSFIKNDFEHLFSCHRNYLNKLGNNCKWLPVACDPNIHKKYELQKIYDITFIGNTNPLVYPERVKLLNKIKQRYNLSVFSNTFGENMAIKYSQSKIVFNKSIRGDINMRVFEAMSCGSMLLTDRLNNEAGLESLFHDGKHLVLYNDEADLFDKIDFYLKHDSEREVIAHEGMKEVHEKHTYKHRTEEMLKTMGIIH
ncbi:MAG: hypothetical protein A2297_06990 [Elusimicrobia bacterium RIFOXYB2_FULL_48_7]|nr:MAG: hypothetical protein A2297_06990 [Elusimicrobia bacterium RIFOXYB2_FULL_48_7]